jgi:hypothetical protein
VNGFMGFDAGVGSVPLMMVGGLVWAFFMMKRVFGYPQGSFNLVILI